MADDKRIEQLIGEIARMGEWRATRDVAGPDASVMFGKEIERVLAAYPFASRADDWLAFLRIYGGGMLTRDRDLLSIGLYGFSDEVTMPLLDGPGEPIDCGCLLFGDVVLPLDPATNSDETISLGFGFEATGERRWGIYRIRDGKESWYCESLIEWMRRFIKLEGRLID